MGKKVKKKARSGNREGRVSTSPKTVSQPVAPNIDSVDYGVSVAKEIKGCSHFDKGVDLANVSSKLGSPEPVRCEDCREAMADRRGGKGRGKHGKKKGGSSVDPKLDSKAIWVCLQCGHYSCGGAGLPTTPQSHAVRHAKQHRHPLAIQFENPHLQWCFPCSTLIPVEKSEENGKQTDALHDVVKMIKAQPSEGTSEGIEKVWFGSGSASSELKSENIFCSDGRSGYVIRGLLNLGNTCFFNSIMQNLLAMDKLRDYFLKLDGSFGPITVALKKLFIETSLEAGLRNSVNPRPLFGSVCFKAPQFRGFQQHDSHELLRCLLDGLCTEESSGRKQTKSSEQDGSPPNFAPTFVDTIFGGKLSSTVTCLECGHSSVVYEPYLDLSLPVPTKKHSSRNVHAVSRAKKSKLPPKKSGRVRSKVSIDSIMADSTLNLSTSGTSYCQIQSTAPTAEKAIVSSADSTLGQSGDTPGGNKDLGPQNISATQESVCNQSTENAAEDTVLSFDDSLWLDYLGPGKISSDDDMPSQKGDISAIQDSENKYLAQADVLAENNFELTQCVCPMYKEKVDTGKLSDDNEMTSCNNEISAIEDSQGKVYDGNDVLKENSNFYSQICSAEKSSKINYSVNSLEYENPSRIEDSDDLLLPYGKGTSNTGDFLREESNISSSAVACDQDPLDFGFGELFNEPEVAAGPNVSSKPVANEPANSGFVVGNSSESDPDEVDNSDSPVSVKSCLAYFTKPELLSRDEHAWHCQNCSKVQKNKRIRLRKNLQKSMSSVFINGGKELTPSAQLSEDNEFSYPLEIRNFSNGIIRIDALGNSDENMAPHSGSVCHEQDCILKANQKSVSNLVTSPSVEGKGVINDTSEQPESSSSFKTCSQARFSCEASDSCSAIEPCDGECSIDDVRDRGLQLSEKHESEGSDNEEMDSEGVKVKRDATKRILIHRAPPILTIHLKRFSQDARGRLSKLNGHVSFGDAIDIRPYMDPRCVEKEKCEYRLIGVVEHLGSMRGGHYVAYVRSAKRSWKADEINEEFVWYHASDAYVREASLEEVLRSEAYVLFYEQV